jgi:hypothetical protein
VYRWDFDDLARQEFATLSHVGQIALAEFMNAAVMVDPIEYQRHPGEPNNPPALLRTLHFGRHHEGLVTFQETVGGSRHAGGVGEELPSLPMSRRRRSSTPQLG